LLVYSTRLDLADDQDVGQRAHHGDAGDIDKAPSDIATLRQIAEHQRCSDAGQVGNAVEGAAGQPDQVTRRHMADQHPANRGHAIAEKGQRHEGNHRLRRIHIIGAEDAGRQQQTHNDGGFARQAEASPTAQDAVGDKAGQLHADKGRHKGQRHIERGLGHAQMAVADQIGGKPGQEEPLAGGDGELAEIDAPQLAILEYGTDIGPAERTLWLGRA